MSFQERGENGALAVKGDQFWELRASESRRRPRHIVDTTGAGDLFASGLLYGLTHGMDPVESARLGGLCAAEVISHTGARP